VADGLRRRGMPMLPLCHQGRLPHMANAGQTLHGWRKLEDILTAVTGCAREKVAAWTMWRRHPAGQAWQRSSKSGRTSR